VALKGLWPEQAGSASGLWNFPAGTLGVGTVGNTDYSASAWLCLDTPVESGTAMGMLHVHENNSTGVSERAFVITRPSGEPAERLGFYGFDSGGYTYQSNDRVPRSRWLHVGVAMKGSTGGRVRFFINGRPEAAQANTRTHYNYGANNVRVGFANHTAGAGFTWRQARYRLAHMAIWDIELEPSDMAALASGRLLPTQIAFGNCMAYFPLVGSLQNLKHPTLSANAPTLTDLANNNWRLTDEDPLRLLRPAFGVSRARFAPAAAPPPANNNNLLLLGVGD